MFRELVGGGGGLAKVLQYYSFEGGGGSAKVLHGGKVVKSIM